MKDGILAFIGGTGVQLQGDNSPLRMRAMKSWKRAGDALN
jgi:hypothetical protein